MLLSVLDNAAVCHNSSPEEVSDYVNRHVGRHRIELFGAEKAASQLSVCQFSDLGLSRISYGNEVRVSCPDLEDIYHFQIVMKGQCQWRFSDTDMVLTPGQALMMNPGEKIDLHYTDDCEKLIVKIPKDVINTTCIDYLGRVPQSGVLFERKAVDIKTSKSFLACVEGVFYEASDDKELCLSGISESYRDLLIRKLLNTFDSNLLDYMQPSGQDDLMLKKVLEYIDSNIKENLTIEELSVMAGMSVRKLYQIFTDRLSTTPRTLIKQRKLAAVHRDLKTNPTVRNVTEAALDYAFTHLGRFSSDYKKAFGELPSETLKNRQV